MMVIKYGRYGKFLACPGYPECKNAKPWVETIDVPCPKCGAKVQVRKTKRKRNYYICENNPASCDYISWTKPKKGEKYVENQDGEEISKEVKKTTSKKKKAKKTGAKKTTAKKTTKRTSTRKKKNSEETQEKDGEKPSFFFGILENLEFYSIINYYVLKGLLEYVNKQRSDRRII